MPSQTFTKTRSLLIKGLLLTALCGCSLYTIDSRYASSDLYPPKSTGLDVQYLETIELPHEVIGTVTVNVERRQTMENILTRMKREAAILGGDAITNIRSNAGEGTWARLKPKELFGNANVRSNFIADVVVFTTPDPGP